ncbi:uncharacterized protein LOC133905950 [Phragmites australis]|uniref:uncharacterized protein LOC133905950 n=1 Tax=Phragmites australis TaxID=29695 RepID=UPI002D76535B|nr:uncharacterized protein LOC133905950 [Phragmites australis]
MGLNNHELQAQHWEWHHLSTCKVGRTRRCAQHSTTNKQLAHDELVVRSHLNCNTVGRATIAASSIGRPYEAGLDTVPVSRPAFGNTIAAKESRMEVSSRPPTSAAKNQGRSEAPRTAPALEPRTPEPSAPAEPGLASAATEPGLAGAEPGLAGPVDAVAETEVQPPPERSAPSKPAPSAPSPPEEARRGPSAQPPPSQPADPLSIVLGSAREVIGRLEAAVAGEMAQREVAWRVFDSRLAAARATNEDEQRAIEEGWKALEEARTEVAREQKTLEDARA